MGEDFGRDDALFAEMVAVFEYGMDHAEERARAVLGRDGVGWTTSVEHLALCIVHATRTSCSGQCIRALALAIHALHGHEVYAAKRDAELEVRAKLQKLANSI